MASQQWGRKETDHLSAAFRHLHLRRGLPCIRDDRLLYVCSLCLRPDTLAAVLHADLRTSGGRRGPQQEGQVSTALRWRRHQDGRTRRRSRRAARHDFRPWWQAYSACAFERGGSAWTPRPLSRAGATVPRQASARVPEDERLSKATSSGTSTNFRLLFGFLSLLAQLPLSIRKDIKRGSK